MVPLTQALAKAQENELDAVEMIALAAEYRRMSEGGHNQRVGQLAAMIATKLGIPEAESEMLERAAPLHDVGTIYIPEKILFKPERLLPEEFEVVKAHVSLGANMLHHSKSQVLRMARLIVETHHERWDGKGYPSGLKGLKIPLVGQIVSVADVFDTMIHDQPYRKALPVMQATAEIRSQSGTGFDPQVVEAFLKVMQERYWVAPNPAAESKRDILLKGRLGAVSVFDLLSMLTQNAQSGCLNFYTSFLHYRIWVYEGRLVHAEYDKSRGEEALMKIIAKTETASRTKFAFVAWQGAAPLPSEITIHKPANQLLFDIAVQLDEARQVAA